MEEERGNELKKEIKNEDGISEVDPEEVDEREDDFDETMSTATSTISNFYDYTPELLSETQLINLSFSNLTKIPADMQTFQNLMVINLSHNKINSIDPELFVYNTPNLKKLDLSHNRLTVLPEIAGLGSLCWLEELNFENNPIPCVDNRAILILRLLLQFPFEPIHCGDILPDEQLVIEERQAQEEMEKLKKQQRLLNPGIRLNDQKEEEEDEEDQPQTYQTKALKRKYGYLPTKRGKPNVKRISQRRLKQKLFMKPTKASKAHKIKQRTTKYDTIPSTLSDSSRYDYKSMQHKSNVHDVTDEQLDLFYENGLSSFSQVRDKVLSADASKPTSRNRQEVMNYRDEMRQFRKQFRAAYFQPFKESLGHLASGKPADILYRLQDCPIPRPFDTPFPFLHVLNGRSISIEEYLQAENERIFQLCSGRQENLYHQHPIDPSIHDLHLDDPIVEDDKPDTSNLKSREAYFVQSQRLHDEIHYQRMCRSKEDLNPVTTFSEARYKVSRYPSMQKILDKSLSDEYTKIEDYRDTEAGKKKWEPIERLLPEGYGIDINFSDILKWEHSQIRRRVRSFMSDKKSKKKQPGASHGSLKYQIESMTPSDIQTKLRKMDLSYSISASKRSIRSPDDVSSSKSNVEMSLRREVLADERSRLLQRYGTDAEISRMVRERHPNDEITSFFHSDSDDSTFLKDKEDILASNRRQDSLFFEHRSRLRERGIKPTRRNLLKEVCDSNEVIALGDSTFSYPSCMV
mmetsp:Transcript_7929/g.11762  ORF Transcript_7929/g.11762 Transcript_7929/m.11762 type:complete len:746 (-) Transcript_7929:35-2272(-)